MRIRLLLGLTLALSVLLAPRMADAVPVQILATQYYVSVRASLTPGSSAPEGTELISIGRSTTSLSPISDVVTISDGYDYGIASAVASADLFAVAVDTAAYPSYIIDASGTGNLVHQGRSGATAESVTTFAPLVDGSATFHFSIATGNSIGLYYSDGFARLEDLTSGNLLWDYAWNYGSSNGHPSSWPFVAFHGPNPNLFVDQALDAAHEYVLTMHISSNANTDHEIDSLSLSGLEVPEPPSAILLGLVALGLWGTRRVR